MPGATFKIEIASDNTFNNVLISQKAIAENHVTLDLSSFASATRYYWRVTTVETGKFDKVSDVASFMTVQRDLAPQATLIYPADGAEIDDNFKFLIADVGADTYKLEVARDAAFTNVVQTANYLQPQDGNLSLQCVISLIGTGTYYWRVATTAAGCDPNMSETRTFTMPEGDVSIEATFEKETPTGIESLSMENVKSVRFYNAAGVESATPFNGVNIVVREMNDGSKSVIKVVK